MRRRRWRRRGQQGRRRSRPATPAIRSRAPTSLRRPPAGAPAPPPWPPARSRGILSKRKGQDNTKRRPLSPTGNPCGCAVLVGSGGDGRRGFIRPGGVALTEEHRLVSCCVGYGPLALCLYYNKHAPGLINPIINRVISWAQTATLEPIRVLKTSFSRCGCWLAGL
jgi:hypothetical protein